MKRVASYLIAPLVCAAVWWRVPFLWFRDDDFAWLSLHQLPLIDALFQPAAQGTVRVLSERAYFLALSGIFGFTAWPFRLVTLLTWFLVLLLMRWLGERLTGKPSAGIWAAVLWTVSLPLLTPLGWASAYNQVLIAALVLTAFAARLRWTDTGAKKWLWLEAAAYLAGFGTLEIIVMYPVVVLLHDRKLWRSTLWMFAPALAFTALHLFVIPKTESPIYQRFFDARLGATLWQYVQWTVGPSQMEVRNAARQTQGLIVTWIIAAALALFSVRRSTRRDPKPLFFVGWFVLWIAPVLPLPNHISDYYLVLPGIGLAWLAGYAITSAPSPVFRVPAYLLALVYIAGSVAEVDAVTKWFLNLTSRARIAVRGVEATHALDPRKAILLVGIDDEVFLHSFAGGAESLMGATRVWLPPQSDRVLDSNRVPDLLRFRVAPDALHTALRENDVRVLDVEGPISRDITPRYRAAHLAAAR